ncbi:MAG: hypothetical protein IPL10_02285 [Bacteroidetes bacterium]|nr:hypothetical protein [Bacteroidota bacterium]
MEHLIIQTQTASTIFSNPGTYTTQLMAISNLNCSATRTLVVTVYPNPVAQFNASPVCEGTQMTFTNQSTSLVVVNL